MKVWRAGPAASPRPIRSNQLDLSPKGERALFAARGDIFTAPIEKGPTRNLTHSSGAHDKWPSWSPDGSQIAFISDMSGEEELYIVPQDGLKAAGTDHPRRHRHALSAGVVARTENASLSATRTARFTS